MALRSSSDSSRSRAPSASWSRSRRRAPISGTMSSPRDSTQAIAVWATVTPLSSATFRSASPKLRLWSRLSPLKRGLCPRKSRSPSGLAVGAVLLAVHVLDAVTGPQHHAEEQHKETQAEEVAGVEQGHTGVHG